MQGFLLLWSICSFFSWCISFSLRQPSAGTPSGASLLPLLFARLIEFSPVLTFAFVFVVLYYFTYLTADGEQTIGKSIFGIRVVTKDGENLGRVWACVRCFCYWISAVPFFLGFLMAFVFRGHALHDILCRTMVVKVQDDW